MSILFTFKMHHWKYEVYNTATAVLCADVLEIAVFWMWQILVSARAFFWFKHASWLTQHSVQFTFYAFYHCWVLVHSNDLMKIYQHLEQRWQKPFSVWKFSDNLLNFSLRNFFMQNLHYDIGFFAKQAEASMKSCLYWYPKMTLLLNSLSSLMVHTFECNFVYFF